MHGKIDCIVGLPYIVRYLKR